MLAFVGAAFFSFAVSSSSVRLEERFFVPLLLLLLLFWLVLLYFEFEGKFNACFMETAWVENTIRGLKDEQAPQCVGTAQEPFRCCVVLSGKDGDVRGTRYGFRVLLCF